MGRHGVQAVVTATDHPAGNSWGCYTQPESRTSVHSSIVNFSTNFNQFIPIFAVLSRPWCKILDNLAVKSILSRLLDHIASAELHGLER